MATCTVTLTVDMAWVCHPGRRRCSVCRRQSRNHHYRPRFAIMGGPWECVDDYISLCDSCAEQAGLGNGPASRDVLEVTGE